MKGIGVKISGPSGCNCSPFELAGVKPTQSGGKRDLESICPVHGKKEVLFCVALNVAKENSHED